MLENCLELVSVSTRQPAVVLSRAPVVVAVRWSVTVAMVTTAVPVGTPASTAMAETAATAATV
jgi:hypothetical protein